MPHRLARASFLVKGLLAAAAALTAPGCQSAASHIDTTATLGKVVVYRSGVAFYERRAHLTDGKLTVKVPRDRVDDFLKSMTILDANTGEHLPVTIPRQQAEAGDFLVMELHTPGRRAADVVLTYVTEASAWKPNYRISMRDGGKVNLEALAVVDNTSGEDWNGVLVGVGSGSALSFRYDLWSVRTIDREQIAETQTRSIAPPTAVSPFAAGPGGGEGGAAIVAWFDASGRGFDSNIPVAGSTFEAALGSAAGAQGDGLGVAFSGSSSLENQYVIDGINTTGLQYGEVISVQGNTPLIDAAGTGHGSTISNDYTTSIDVGGGDGGGGGGAPRGIARRDYTQFDAMVKRLRSQPGQLVIQALTSPGVASTNAQLAANTIKDQLIDAGLSAARVSVEVASAQAGEAAPLRVVLIPPQLVSDDASKTAATSADGDQAPVGESHFLSTQAMDVPAATSALVSVFSMETDGNIAYLYDPVSERGDARYAFRAVRMDNPTDQTLEAGPLTVYGEDAFIGEGLTESIPPRATTVVPFAQDRQVLIDRSITFSDRIIRVAGIDRQLMSADLEHRRRTHLLIHNRLTVPTTVYVRQAINDGWTVIAPPTGALRLPTSFLIPVEVAAGGTATLDINEGTPQRRELAMGDRAAMRLLATFAAEGKIDDSIRKPLEQVLATDDAIARAQVEVESLREQQLAYLERTRELAAQLVTLKLVKTAGPLMSELSDKLRELNTLSSQASMMVIAAQDRWLIERARQAAQLIELRVATGAASRLAAADID